MVCAIVFVAGMSRCVVTSLKRPNRGNLQSRRFHGILKGGIDNAATKSDHTPLAPSLVLHVAGQRIILR